MSAVAILCTRLDSRRLPGKAVKLVAGVPAIFHIVRRLKKTGLPIVIAMPETCGFDLPGADWDGCVIYRGEGESPLHRMAAAMSKLYPKIEYVVRVTHDDLLVDPQTILDLIARAESEDAGYATSPEIVEGAGVEVIHRDNLLHAAEARKEPTEFVSYFVKGAGVPWPKAVTVRPRFNVCRPYRLTMDFPKDHVVLEAVLRAVGPDAPLDEVVAYLDRHKGLAYSNRLPELSFYTCAKDAQKTVAATVLSVSGYLARNRGEHIIVDDASTDQTLTEIASEATEPYHRVIVNEKNVGLASSSNKALSECTGKYVCRIDADDYLLNEFQDEWPAIRAKLEAGAPVVYPAFEARTPDGDTAPWDPSVSHHVGGAIFNRAFLNELRFRDGLRHWDGLDVLKRMREVGARIEYYNVATWFYRDMPGSMSKSTDPEREKTRQELLQ